MSTEENKKIARRFVEEWNRGNREGIYSLFARDFVAHDPFPLQASGVERVRQALGGLFDALPDSKITLELVIAEADKVAYHAALTGTNKGSLFGAPPTGKQVTILYTDIYRIKDGKIVEGWHVGDLGGSMQQTGATPVPQSASA